MIWCIDHRTWSMTRFPSHVHTSGENFGLCGMAPSFRLVAFPHSTPLPCSCRKWIWLISGAGIWIHCQWETGLPGRNTHMCHVSQHPSGDTFYFPRFPRKSQSWTCSLALEWECGFDFFSPFFGFDIFFWNIPHAVLHVWILLCKTGQSKKTLDLLSQYINATIQLLLLMLTFVYSMLITHAIHTHVALPVQMFF